MVTNVVFFHRTAVKQNNNQTHFLFSLICNTNFNNLKHTLVNWFVYYKKKTFHFKVHKVDTAKHILMS